jgi:hypothetical protein
MCFIIGLGLNNLSLQQILRCAAPSKLGTFIILQILRCAAPSTRGTFIVATNIARRGRFYKETI